MRTGGRVSRIKKTLHVLSVLSVVFPVLFCMRSGDAASAVDMPEYAIFSAPETHMPVRLRLGKPQIVHLDAAVGDVTVDGLPQNVTAVAYGEKSIVLIPHNLGAAHITILGKNGEPLMARYAIVVAVAADKYVRIHQTCKKTTGADCEKKHVYYCPNLCYETRLVNSTTGQAATK